VSAFAPDWAWDILEIGPDADQRGIKKAYSRLLKMNRPEDDAAAFQAVHQAYQAALAYAAQRQQESAPVTIINTSAQEATAPVPLQDTVPLQKFVLDHPHAQATQVWQRFLDLPAHLLNERIALLTNDAALDSFATRDAVELLALQMAADPACEPRLRVRLANHFGWDADMAHLMRREPALAAAALAQLRADAGMETLTALQGDDEALRFLLAPTPPAELDRTRDSSFYRAMRARVDSLRWQYPEVIEHRLDPAVFAWWAHYVDTKKYFVQTGMWSFAAGLVLFFLVQWQLTIGGMQLGALALACVGGSMATVAWLVLRPPLAPLAAWARLRERHLDTILYERRFEVRWQFGWLAGLIGLAPMLLIPEPARLIHLLVSAGLAVCAVLGLFAASATVRPGRLFVALMLALMSGFLMRMWGFAQFSFASFAFSVSMTLLAAQNGAHLYATLGLRVRGRLMARLAWMVGLALFYMGSDLFALSAPASGAVAMLFLVSGVILARAVLRYAMAWPAIIVVKFAAFSDSGNAWARLPAQNAFLIAAIAIVAIFMISSMFTDETD
jgi:hypothetical protein